MGKIVHKQPTDCSGFELDKFEDLVKKGGEVPVDGLRERIMRAEWLVSIVEEDGTLAAVAALKQPTNSYKRRVFLKARTSENADDFTFEAGWMFVEDAFRGRKYSRLLLEALLTLAGEGNVYVTTREVNKRMRRTNLRCGFVQSGFLYISDQGDYKLVLYTRRSVR